MDGERGRSRVIVMLSNNTGWDAGWFAGAYPGRIGHLMPPKGWRQPKRRTRYALDNGAFSAYLSGEPWDEGAFLALLEAARTATHPPLWVVVPDVVANRLATLALWHQWAPAVKDYGWPLAFAVQDGMTQADVPDDADVIFVGGTKEWKRATLLQWCADNERVHVGRVNDYEFLWACHDAEVESCDGTGWLQGDQAQLAGLERYLEESTSGGRAQARLLA